MIRVNFRVRVSLGLGIGVVFGLRSWLLLWLGSGLYG